MAANNKISGELLTSIEQQWVLDQLHAMGMRTTPDGARYNKTNILAVLRDLE